MIRARRRSVLVAAAASVGLVVACSGLTPSDLFGTPASTSSGGCGGLASCCVQLVPQQQSDCDTVAGAGDDSKCSSLLATFQMLGGCTGGSSTGTGTGTGTATSTSSSSSSDNATSVLLFGGYGPADVNHSDTWTWDGVRWIQAANSGPPARDSAVMASLGGSLVLFGGGTINQEQSLLADTWRWDGTSWTMAADSGPFPRAGAAMASLGGKLVLFGGYGDGDEDLSDTWVWDGVTWTQLQIGGPSARDSAVMAPFNGQLILFGGGQINQEVSQLSDTWAFNGTAWMPVATNGSPPARAGAVMGPIGGELLLFGGYGFGQTDLADTWTWNGSAWSQVAVDGPSARDSAAMAPLQGKLVLFGGGNVRAEGSQLADTWIWDGTVWGQAESTAAPSPRSGAVMAAP